MQDSFIFCKNTHFSMERSWLRAISSALVQERNKGLRALTPKTVVHSVKSANSRYCCPDRADSRSNVLLITVHDGRRRPASAALAFRQGFRRTLCCFRAHMHRALTAAHMHACRHTRMHKVHHYLLSSKYQMVCTHRQNRLSDNREAMYPTHNSFFIILPQAPQNAP